MHVGGEVDIRGVYCALSVARLTGVYTHDMFRGTELWVARWVGASANYTAYFTYFSPILLQ